MLKHFLVMIFKVYKYITQITSTDWIHKPQSEERTWTSKCLDYKRLLAFFWPLKIGIVLGIKRPYNFRVEMNLGSHESKLLSCIRDPSMEYSHNSCFPAFINREVSCTLSSLFLLINVSYLLMLNSKMPLCNIQELTF